MFRNFFNGLTLREAIHSQIETAQFIFAGNGENRDPFIDKLSWKLGSAEWRAQMLEIHGTWPPLPESTHYAEKDLVHVERIRKQLGTPSVDAALQHRRDRAQRFENMYQQERDDRAVQVTAENQAIDDQFLRKHGMTLADYSQKWAASVGAALSPEPETI